jgi:hypothetical protein
VFFTPSLYYAIETLLEKIKGPRAAPMTEKPVHTRNGGQEEGEQP